MPNVWVLILRRAQHSSCKALTANAQPVPPVKAALAGPRESA